MDRQRARERERDRHIGGQLDTFHRYIYIHTSRKRELDRWIARQREIDWMDGGWIDR